MPCISSNEVTTANDEYDSFMTLATTIVKVLNRMEPQENQQNYRRIQTIMAVSFRWIYKTFDCHNSRFSEYYTILNLR